MDGFGKPGFSLEKNSKDGQIEIFRATAAANALHTCRL